MTAAERIAAWATGLEPDAVPEDVRTDAKLHVLDVIGCGLAAHATGVAHEGRATMGELGGRPRGGLCRRSAAGSRARVRRKQWQCGEALAPQ